MLPTIKVCFSFRKDDLKKWYTDFFCGILDKRYQIVIEEINPDFIFHEAHLVDVLDYSGVRIAVSGENVRTDFNISDYGIGFDHLSFQDRYLRFPLYMMYTGSLDMSERRKDVIDIDSSDAFLQRKFCNFLVSNGTATEFRTQFFHRLSKYKSIESGGGYLNNIGGKVSDKSTWQREFKFSLCFENSSTSGYLTEKLIQAYAAMTVPIYWGDPDAVGSLAIGKGGINPKALIWVDQNEPSKAIHKIEELDSNRDLFLAYLREPLFLEEDHSQYFKKRLENFLYSIFDQRKELAYRRGFGQVRMRVEKRQIARSNGFKSLITYFKKRLRN